MSEFRRRLHQLDWAAYPVLKALLDRWALPGTPSETHGLRLAIRDGYVNFYRKGQSVAKLRTSSRGAKLEVHEEYVAERRKFDRGTERLRGYKTFNDEWLRKTNNIALVDRWIATAETYAGSEKSFVDDLIAGNSCTIDIEMGLPAHSGERSAPRMDLVVVDSGNQLAFWEAKCADNGEIRAKQVPHVVGQVERYVQWVEHDGAASSVVAAYREAAGILLKLAEAGQKPDGAAQAAWRSFRDAVDAKVIGQPGIVIGNYCPATFVEQKLGNIAARAVSFEGNGHRERLEDEFGLVLDVYTDEGTARQRPLRSLAGASR